jgi:glucose/arabinose dehydrogenase
VQPGYKVEIVATGFQLPVNIAFIPAPGLEPNAPFFYVTELYGTIKVVTRDGMVSDYATDLLNFDPTGNFPGSGEQGLTGLVVDPASGDVYASMLYNDDPSDDGAPHYPKVMRFQSLDGGRTASTGTVILDMFPEIQGQSHQISNLSIGPDGKLYVHMGDGFSARTARDLDAFRGKILRMNLDGSPAVDNPFYDAADGINARDYVYASGFRNPFGGAWSAADGSLYEVENGPRTDRFAKVVPGQDYLWDGDDPDLLNFAIYNWSPSHAPVNIVFIQPETFDGSGFPAEKMDHAFVSESGPTYASGPVSGGKRISEFVIDEEGNVVGDPIPLIEYNGSGKATVAGLAAGPDGLYFSDLYKDLNFDSPIDRGAKILRVVPDVPVGRDSDFLAQDQRKR